MNTEKPASSDGLLIPSLARTYAEKHADKIRSYAAAGMSRRKLIEVYGEAAVTSALDGAVA